MDSRRSRDQMRAAIQSGGHTLVHADALVRALDKIDELEDEDARLRAEGRRDDADE